jgi:hypothetical protein
MSWLNDPKPLREFYRNRPESEAPLPWKRVPIRMSSVVAAGFGANSELLAVLTHSGLGIVDAVTGKIVTMSTEETESVSPIPVSITGIGPLSGERVALAGIWGGGLKTMTLDGWVLHRIAPNWPFESVILCSPDFESFEDEDKTTTIFKDVSSEIRAFGFSDSGQSLVVASEDLRLWTRS